MYQKRSKEEIKYRHNRGQEALCEIDDAGFKPVQLSEYHYRINNRTDFWPTSLKWYDRITQKTGTGTRSLIAYLKTQPSRLR